MTQTMMFEMEARDEALDRVLANAGPTWQERAAAVLCSMTEREITGEDIRLACESANVRPHHHNAWGGLTLRFIRDGLIEPTGCYRAMTANGSHGRKTQVYRRVTA